MPRRGQVSWVAFEIPFGPAGATGGALYEQLLEDDRPIAWFGLDSADPTVDDSGHGYTLTAVGAPTGADTLIPHGDGVSSGCRDFNGSADAYYTLGTLYANPIVPPPFHAATAGAGSANDVAKVTSPNGILAGDLMLAVLVHSTQSATMITAPSGWTQVGSTLNAGTHAVAVYKRLPVQDEPANEYQWTWSSTGTLLQAIAVYRGCDQNVSGLIYDSGQQSTASDSFHSTTTETNPLQAHALAIWTGDFSGAIVPNPTGLKSRANISNSTVQMVLAEYDRSGAGSYTATSSTSAATTLGAVLVTFGSALPLLENSVDQLSELASIHAVIRPDTVTGVDTIVRKHQAYGLQLNAGVVEFLYRDGGGTDRTITGPSVSAGQTTHLVVTDDGTNIHFYKNGVETTSARTGSAGYTTNANRLVIGAYYDGSYSNFFDGRMDEVAIFAAPLSDQMVATYYEAFSTGNFGHYLQPLPGRYPRGKLEIAWASHPTDQTLIWEDVTSDLRAAGVLSPTRGRNMELDRIETGRMDFMLDNRERQYDSTYTGSPYYPNVKPTRAVRLRTQVETDASLHRIFFGYTEGHPLRRAAGGVDSMAQFTAADPFKALALDKIRGTFVRSQELSGARIQALLDGEPGIPYTGEAGQSEIIGDDLSGSNVLDHVQQVTETEGGVLFANGTGTVVFQDRHHRTKFKRAVQATYGDGGGAELPLKHMEPQTDEARLFTAASVTPSSGNPKIAIETNQALDHFVRTKEVTTLHASDNDAQAMAEAFASRYATPRTRIPAVVLQPAGHTDPLGMWETVLTHEISDRIRTIERPLGDTTSVTRDHFIEGIRHDITASDWHVVLSVSPAELEGEYWLLGTGELGDASGLTATVLGW